MVKVPELGFNGKKLKPLLNQSIIRIQMVKQKRSANIQQQMKLVAKLLGDGQVSGSSFGNGIGILGAYKGFLD